MSLTVFLHRVIRILDEAELPYMLTGSLAAAYYATPRATQDVDVVIAASEAGIERVVRGFADAGWYVDVAAAKGALRTRGQFNAIDPEAGWKVDLIVRKDRAFSRVEFDRRRRVTLLGVEAWMASVEDVLIAKLEWSNLGDSELQRRDVARLLEREEDRLDMAYLERWIGELGLEADWAAIRDGRSE